MQTTPVFCGECGTICPVGVETDEPPRCADCLAPLPRSTGEDVFISYSTPQLAQARRLGRRLHEDGIPFWLAPEFIRPSDDFTRRITAALERARVVVLLLSAESLRSPWVELEAATAVSRRLKLIAVRLGGVALPAHWNFMLGQSQWVEADAEFSDEFVRAVTHQCGVTVGSAILQQEQLEALQDLPPRSTEPLKGVSQDAEVYVGPRPYPDDMAGFFFGRNVEINQIIEHLNHHPTVLLISPSGAGKSSLLNVGLTPRFRDAGHQVYAAARVGRSLPQALRSRREAVANIFTFSTLFGLGHKSEPPRLDATLREAFDALPRPEPGRRRILILDQFEEIFTQHRDRFGDRHAWVEQFVEMLCDDADLRVVLAMRQEYLADFQLLFDGVSPAYYPRRVRIGRLRGQALRDAIERPAARFVGYDPAVVDEILRQLHIVRFIQPDGSTIEKPGEFIELCHLQIVCQRLWKSMPPGVTRVEPEHLGVVAEAYAEQRFGTFVKDALEKFYNNCVTEAANSDLTRRMGGFHPDLIKMGCMKFVTREGTRVSVQEGRTRTGRLPNWIVKQLADAYLLRIDSIGNERWYELSHDLVAQAIQQTIDPGVDQLLHASDMLEKQLAQTLETRPAGLDDLFPELPETLAVCQPFQLQAGLFPDEAEFVMRISLRTGREISAWSQRLRQDHPEVLDRVLDNATRHPDPAVRAHAAEAVWSDPDDRSVPRLTGLLVDDPAASVRSDAARALLRLADRDGFEALADRMVGVTEAERPRLQRAVSLLRAYADVAETPTFERSYRHLPRGARTPIRLRAWGRRFLDALPLLPGVFLPAALFAAAIAGPFKMLPAAFDWALVQDEPGVGKGLFHGIVAGVIWGGLIPTGLMLYRTTFWRAGKPAGLLRPVGTLVAGAVSGVIASAIVTASILGVYSHDSLRMMGWIHTQTVGGGSGVFLRDLFTQTRMGWSHMILGTALGLGFALTANLVKADGRWDAYLHGQHAISRARDVWEAVGRLTRIVLPNAWPLLFTQGITTVLVWWLLVPGDGTEGTNRYVFVNLAGDAATQAVGAVAATVGACFGLLILRRGLSLQPRRDPF
ncbi:MAG: toll/interleukin-1 receptor domain-containing protein [Planctomycetota bacterium]